MILKPIIAASITALLYFIFIPINIKKKGKKNSKPYVGGIIFTVIIFPVFLVVYNF